MSQKRFLNGILRRRREAVGPLAVPLTVLVVTLAMSVGCGGAGREDPILRLSAVESLEEGKRLLEAEKYRTAKDYLLHAFEVEPNSSSGREGLLLAADALFLRGGFDSWVESESRYRDFLNRFPTSPRADYAQFRIAQSLIGRMEKPTRDQQVTRKAYTAFEDLIRLFPTSDYVEQARDEMVTVKQRLAEHEWVVAFYYFRASGGSKRSARLAGPAVSRLEYLMETYPEYTEMDKIYAHLCRAHDRLEQPEKAARACTTLRDQYPDSEHVKSLPKHLRSLTIEEGEVAAAAIAAEREAAKAAREVAAAEQESKDETEPPGELTP